MTLTWEYILCGYRLDCGVIMAQNRQLGVALFGLGRAGQIHLGELVSKVQLTQD